MAHIGTTAGQPVAHYPRPVAKCITPRCTRNGHIHGRCYPCADAAEQDQFRYIDRHIQEARNE